MENHVGNGPDYGRHLGVVAVAEAPSSPGQVLPLEAARRIEISTTVVVGSIYETSVTSH